jgi:argininosuccinate synthase
MRRVVLAYSGGLDITATVSWLAGTGQAEVVAVTVDLGQGRELESVRDRALSAGCVRAHVLDACAEFADHYVLPTLQAGAAGGLVGTLASALARPLIAVRLIEIARIEAASAVACDCPNGSDDLARTGVYVQDLAPGLELITPAAGWRQARSDVNIWGRSVEGGALEDAGLEPPADCFTMTSDPASAPLSPAFVEISFEKGLPTAVNGVAMPFVDIIGSLNTIAGNAGVGRTDVIEDRLSGHKVRVVCEAPAAVVLHQAHAGLEQLVSSRDLQRVKQGLAATYADLVHTGHWYSPLREALDAFVAKSQEPVTGTVRVRLFRGTSVVVGRRGRELPVAASSTEAA